MHSVILIQNKHSEWDQLHNFVVFKVNNSKNYQSSYLEFYKSDTTFASDRPLIFLSMISLVYLVEIKREYNPTLNS